MPNSRRTLTRHPGDRLRNFTDGVVAIAITLLALPLIDIGTGLEFADMQELRDRLGDRAPAFFAFAVSFFVIARLWWAHHSLIECVSSWRGTLVVANILWLFSIVLIPVMTPLVTEFSPNWLVSLLYVGVMTASSALLSTMAFIISREIRDKEHRDRHEYRGALQRWYGNLITTSTFVLALGLCMVFPGLDYSPLVLLALTPVADTYLRRRAALVADSGQRRSGSAAS